MPSLSCNNNLFVYLEAMLWAKSVSPSASGLLLSKDKIQSVSFAQVLGEIVVVGSHFALSWHKRHGQSTIDSIDAGSLLGKSR